jgi:hypothetical protein
MPGGNMMTQPTRSNLQQAFDRHRVRYGLAKAEAKLAAACGTREVAKVANEQIGAGFAALAINPGLLAALGVPPLTPSKFPQPKHGQSVEARLGEMASAIYARR